MKPPKHQLFNDFFVSFLLTKKWLESEFKNDLYMLPETSKISLLCTDLPPFI